LKKESGDSVAGGDDAAVKESARLKELEEAAARKKKRDRIKTFKNKKEKVAKVAREKAVKMVK
tara:strand:+ start:196 stop:384 length:189 start_codon:yes stop_codon:yes gene_type:complete